MALTKAQAEDAVISPSIKSLRALSRRLSRGASEMPPLLLRMVYIRLRSSLPSGQSTQAMTASAMDSWTA